MGLERVNQVVALMDWEKADAQLKVQVEVRVKQQREVEVKAEVRV